MAVNYEFHNWGLGCELTRCHIHSTEKKGLSKHTLELMSNTDIVVISGKKWEVLYIKL